MNSLIAISAWSVWIAQRSQRPFDEREYIVDGRRLAAVTVTRRYQEISLEEWDKTAA
jgi:hypothetical protein